MTNTETRRICFFGTYEKNYLRNRTLIEGLRCSGWQVFECHVPLWEKERNKTGKYLNLPSLIVQAFQLIIAYIKLIFKYIFKIGKYDIMIVGYIGHLDIPLAWLLTRLSRRPLVFSPLISLYDTLVCERSSFREGSLMSLFLRWLDRWACARSDLVLLDTNAHINYFSDTFNLNKHKLARVFVGAIEPDISTYQPNWGHLKGRKFRIVSIGKFTPLHGLPYMLEAAQQLNHLSEISFHFIGSGQLVNQIIKKAQSLALTNVHFPGWISYNLIPNYINHAHVCLGIFGMSNKSSRVIPGKVFEALSMGKAVITGDSPAMRELLIDGENVILCPRGDPKTLAKKILQLYQDHDVLQKVARGGYQVFYQKTTPEKIGITASQALEKLLIKSPII